MQEGQRKVLECLGVSYGWLPVNPVQWWCWLNYFVFDADDEKSGSCVGDGHSVGSNHNRF